MRELVGRSPDGMDRLVLCDPLRSPPAFCGDSSDVVCGSYLSSASQPVCPHSGSEPGGVGEGLGAGTAQSARPAARR